MSGGRTAVRRESRWRAALAAGALASLASASPGCRSTRGRPEPVDGRISAQSPPAAVPTAAAPASPAEVLRQAVLAHERLYLARGPQLVSEKFARMGRSSFSFFRGTAWMFATAEPSRFKTPASSQVAVLGDPHPENIGTIVKRVAGVGSGRVLEFNDFDLAAYGSYVDDLRRLGVGIWIVGDMADLKRKVRGAAVAAMVDGYVSEVRALAKGEPPFVLAEGSFGGHLDDILVKPDDNEFANGDPATADEQALVRSVMAGYPETLSTPLDRDTLKKQLALKQVIRRNAGVSSFPLLRFQALIEGPTADAADDQLLEIKESTGQPAAQVLAIQKQFVGAPNADPWLGWAAAGGREFRVRGLSPEQRRISADRMAKWLKNGPSGKDDLKEWARAFGKLLARGHCRANDAGQRPGLAAIVEAVTDPDGLATETATFAEQQADANKLRLKTFRDLLSTKGPLLGWAADPAPTLAK